MVKAILVLTPIVPRIGLVFKDLAMTPGGSDCPTGGRAPHARRAPRLYLLPVLVVLSNTWGIGGEARAQPPAQGPRMVLSIGPLGAADYSEGGWDSAFGGELGAFRERPQRRLRAFGLGLGATRHAQREGGRVWVDLFSAIRLGPLSLGATAGPVVAMHRFRAPRYGAQVGIFAYAGPTPYARIGSVEKNGTFVEIGIRIPLPALVW